MIASNLRILALTKIKYWLELVFLRNEMREKRDEGKVLESKIKSVTPNSGQTLVSNKSNKSKAIRGFILLHLPKEIKLRTQCEHKSESTHQILQ